MILELALIIGSPLLVVGSYFGYRTYQNNQHRLLVKNSEIDRLEVIRPKISWCRFLENVGDYGEKLSQQFKTIQGIHAASLTMIKQKFHENELTYNRYQQVIGQSDDILIDNLYKVIPLLQALDSLNDPQAFNRQTLIVKIEEILALNQQLIEKLNELIINLSQLKSLAGTDQKETVFLLENLNQLIDRAKRF